MVLLTLLTSSSMAAEARIGNFNGTSSRPATIAVLGLSDRFGNWHVNVIKMGSGPGKKKNVTM